MRAAGSVCGIIRYLTITIVIVTTLTSQLQSCIGAAASILCTTASDQKKQHECVELNHNLRHDCGAVVSPDLPPQRPLPPRGPPEGGRGGGGQPQPVHGRGPQEDECGAQGQAHGPHGAGTAAT